MTSPRATGAHAAPRPPHRSRWKLWASIAVWVLLLAAIWILADAAGPDPDPVAPAAAPPSSAPPTSPTPAPGPLTTLEPRTEPYPVGPGPGAVAIGATYVASSPTSSGTPCYWARLRGTNNMQSDIIQASRRLRQFTVGPRDKWVQVLGCSFTKQKTKQN